MKTIKISMYVEIDDTAVENLQTITHHAESLLDLDSWPEIHSVFGVTVQEQTTPDKSKLVKDDIPEFKGQIVDIFEDYCDEHNIQIINQDRDEYAKEAGYNDDDSDCDAAIIFGEDYDAIADTVENFIEAFNLLNETLDGTTPNGKKNMQNICAVIFDEFAYIIKSRGTPNNIPTSDVTMLKNSIEKTFTAWGIYICQTE